MINARIRKIKSRFCSTKFTQEGEVVVRVEADDNPAPGGEDVLVAGMPKA